MFQMTPAAYAPASKPVLATPRVQIGAQVFWVLFVVQALLVVIGATTAIRALPVLPAAAVVPDYGLVREAVLQRVNGQTLDPLVDVAAGVRAPASSVRGFSLHGQVYYYYFEGRQRFDPLSQQPSSANQARVVLRDQGGEATLVIYTLISER
ncbi:MAG: hypothetical protein H7Z42_17955 [Roseiflexaceae bacterium]|nr:hypothetical protein [Roseiflexaceae bacterium]